jgi:predicted lipoprotein with Yx(FWY)xxD motif
MHRRAPSRTLFSVAAVVAAVWLAGCTGAASPSPSPSPAAPSTAPSESLSPSPSPAASASPSASTSAQGETYHVTVGKSATVAKFLAGEDGKTLYVFKQDTANTSNCSGPCAQMWPPFTLESGEKVTAGTGVKGKLTTFARADGKMQVAYNGAPLYYYAPDQKAGDVMGQGFGGVWFAATP